jgi:hypothetical protein
VQHGRAATLEEMAEHRDDLSERRDAAAREMARLRERDPDAAEGDAARDEPDDAGLGRRAEVAGEEQRRTRETRDADR